MPTGLDTRASCGNLAAAIKAQGYHFVGRYHAHNPAKRIMQDEGGRSTAADLAILTVWEDAPTSTDYFSHANSVDDGTSAYHMAMQLGQPAGPAIHFAVDFDAPQTAIAGAIADYFRGIADGFAAISLSRQPAYLVGVYGSGALCSWFLDPRLARYAWLAQSTGCSGYRGFANWNVKQGAETQLLGIAIDPGDAKDDAGMFSIPLIA
jgi:hypothetical protein